MRGTGNTHYGDFQNGDLAGLYDRHHAGLFRFAFRLTGNASDAEELVQECFLSLLKPGASYDPEKGPADRYLLGVVRNLARKRLRQRESFMAEPPEEASTSNPESIAVHAQTADAVAAAIAALPVAQREVLILSFYHQNSIAEIAAVTGIDSDAVKSRLYRARTTLKSLLAHYAPLKEASK